MEQRDLNKEKVELLLNKASRKLGCSPSELQAQLQKGQLDAALKNVTPEQSAKINRLISNPKALDEVLKSPQAQALIKQLTQGK